MKRFVAVSIGLFFSSLSLTCRVDAQSSTTTIDNTPKYPSLCIFSKDTKGIAYGKPYKVIAQNGEKAIVVADLNYTNTFNDLALSLLTGEKSKHPEYFSIWSKNEILFQTENLPHSMSAVIIDIGNKRFLLERSYEEQAWSSACRYGNETEKWRKYTIGYRLPEDAIASLRNNSGKSNVKIIYVAEQGNKVHKTEFPIGDGTIQTWRKIDEFYSRMAEKNKPVETQSVEKPESNTSPPINNEE
jgi:hypothetical protein